MKLAVQCNRVEDELLSSWITRCALANGSDPKSFYIALWKQYKSAYYDLDRHTPLKLLKPLAQVTHCSISELESLTLHSSFQNISAKSTSVNIKKSWDFVIPLGKRGAYQSRGIQYCPLCLQDMPYFKKHWRMAWNTSCDLHKVKLLSLCSKCGMFIDYHKIDYKNPYLHLCGHCGYDLRKADIEVSNPKIIEIQTVLNDAFFEGNINSSLPLVELSLHDLFLTLKSLIALIKTIHGTQKYDWFFEDLYIKGYDFEDKSRTSLELMGFDDRESILMIIHMIFKLEFHELERLFSKLSLTEKTFTQHCKVMSPTIKCLFMLSTKSMDQKSKRVVKNEVIPRSKLEVEQLFKQIEGFMCP